MALTFPYERSLTTILYLMSLTEHARALFALVDEFNEGLDQRAERCIHNELVTTTCEADDAGQYFLTTRAQHRADER